MSVVRGLIGGAPTKTNFGKSRDVRTQEDKEHKRSKRGVFSGLRKDKGKDDEKHKENVKEKEISQPIPQVSRSPSVHLFRKSQGSDLPPTREVPAIQTSIEPQHVQQAQQPQHVPRASVYYPPPVAPSTRSSQTSQAALYQQYQRAGIDLDSPESDGTHHSVEYAEDRSHFSEQQELDHDQIHDRLHDPRHEHEHEQYQAFRTQISANNSEERYLPYQQEHQQHHQFGNVESGDSFLRPPSNSSREEIPSPITTPSLSQLNQDSRPSTAATNRHSAQSVSQAAQAVQATMARGEGPNGSLRPQLSQREARSDEQSPYPLPGQADPRARTSQQQVSDQGRSTPPPRSREDISQLDYAQLLQRHEELQAKYSKVKRYYFERENQVTQLQNTVANQRMSMSKTSLDDAQYTARFERLSQAINNLSFNIRKNWRAIPPWLRHVSNQDAHTVGTKEMTALGRACITRWLYESIFQQTFHPGVEPSLSAQLKRIEHSLRRGGQAGTLLTDEQRDDLTTKITNWRLTTVEGLHEMLVMQSEHFIEAMTKHWTNQLTESLKANLTDPPPPGLAEGVGMIIGQAVGIASNIPLESRDICIEYFMPGTPVNETYMKIEPQILPLSNPGVDERLMQQHAVERKGRDEGQEGDQDGSNEDGARERDVEAEIREATSKATANSAQHGGAAGSLGRNESIASNNSQATLKGLSEKQAKKSSFLGGFVSKKPSMSARGGERPDTATNNGGEGEDARGNVRQSMAIDPSSINSAANMNEGRIRFAAFVAVEVRGKGLGVNAPANNAAGKEPGSAATGQTPQPTVNVLFKAPVYEY
jgi:hypothetical protein